MGDNNDTRLIYRDLNVFHANFQKFKHYCGFFIVDHGDVLEIINSIKINCNKTKIIMHLS